MKGVIAGLCALSAIANAQFNVYINNGGLRVGILGSEVANVGGQNQQNRSSDRNRRILLSFTFY